MTTEEMEMIKHLNQVFYAKNKIISLSNLIKDMKSLGAMNYESNDSVKSTHTNSTDKKFNRIAEFTEKLEIELKTFSEICNNTYNIIKYVEDSDLETVLLNRYLRCMTWEQIAEEMNYSLPTLYRKHRKSLKKLVELRKNDSK